MLSSHRAITRVGVTALLFTFVIAFNQHTTAQAGPEAALPIPQSLLPDTVGVGIRTSEAVELTFREPMNTESVEAALALSPEQPATFSWSEDQTTLSIAPERLWRADAGYLVTVDASATTASGSALSAPRRFAFSTQTAPRVADFQVRLAEIDLPEVERADADRILAMDAGSTGAQVLTPSETARDVSASSAVRIGFSAPMNRAAVEEAFSIAPDVAGDLTWVDGDLVFTPTERLEAGGRYTISLVGARDTVGNELGDKVNFSFVVRAGPQLTRTTPTLSASDVEPATVEMWFSQPMNVDATNAAFSLIDTTTGRPVPGRLNWNETATQIVYSPDARLAGGRTFTVVLGDGAADAAGRPIVAKWSFTTLPREADPEPEPEDRTAAGRNAAAAAAPAPPVPAIDYSAYAASGLEGYGLAQINGARAAYGFPPLVLDPTLSAMASAHAWDQIYGGYYAHAARPGGYSAWGENQCHHYANSAQGTIDWCHSVFMSEPWPGYPNHIGNILSTRYTRVGIGIADSGSRVVITWDFAN
jgi:uncharacterized protein YkwD